ncbi:cholesterol esterase [Scheffersomyces spartinae]|uniref:Cholesterol esterase n=1 Tax=Scheffersomyces spartinae TaxID=45513 RepID=A0A9P7VEC7_9ASCO|nr:cholesterol esterase [Scheffersomyces spartinae]KAG7196122.1 cholesterol esterase [Scheffersomyces spartinae]
MRVPFLGRLSITEWSYILVSFTVAYTDAFLSLITSYLPTFIIDLCTSAVQLAYHIVFKNLFVNYDARAHKYTYSTDMENSITFEETQPPSPKTLTLPADFKKLSVNEAHKSIDLINCKTFEEMCHLRGFDVEEHIVKTSDNYLLTLHRLVRSPDADTTISSQELRRRYGNRVVYLHHGLLMCSEIWVTMLEEDKNLPFLLHKYGFDVWLGNNRGNKYSQKHLHYPSLSTKFWNFSLDEFALFDIPETIDYILKVTKVPKLTYIGFSQGTAQAFAAVSINPDLNDKLDQIIAIAPAITPKGLHSKILDMFLKISPNVIYLIFSRKLLMPSVILWNKIVYPPLFTNMIDRSNKLLFNWASKNISPAQKVASYNHLYSPTLVKTVVHWFQIMAAKRFQMYHEDITSYAISPTQYPINNIQVPITLVYGDTDSLVDIKVMLSQLPRDNTEAIPVAGHEHLDMIWGADVDQLVFTHVIRKLFNNFADKADFLLRTSESVHNFLSNGTFHSGLSLLGGKAMATTAISDLGEDELENSAILETDKLRANSSLIERIEEVSNKKDLLEDGEVLRRRSHVGSL